MRQPNQPSGLLRGLSAPPVRVVMSNPEAANYLNVSESWLNRRRCYGGGPVFTRAGRKIIYLKQDLDAYLQSQRCG